jgi:hypothetical protein
MGNLVRNSGTELSTKECGVLKETWRQPEYTLLAREVEDGFITKAYYVKDVNGDTLRVTKQKMIPLVGMGLVANLTLRKVQDTIQIIGVGTSVGLYPKVRTKLS